MRPRLVLPALAAAALAATAAAQSAAAQSAAQPAAQPPAKAPTEKLTLKGRKGPKLLRPGFEVGEFTGSASSMARNVKLLGAKDFARVDFEAATPDMAQPVVADCAGGQSQFKLVITWDRDPISYNCNFGGAAPPDARLELAFARGNGVLSRLRGDNRAGEIHWKDQVIRFETAPMKGLPLSAGKPAAYVFSKDGVEIGRLDIVSGMGLSPPSFEVPVKGAPEREPVTMAMLALYFFQDPGDRR